MEKGAPAPESTTGVRYTCDEAFGFETIGQPGRAKVAHARTKKAPASPRGPMEDG